MAWRCEGCPGELLGVETIGSLLRRIVSYGQGAFDGFTPETSISKGRRILMRHLLVVRAEAILIFVLLGYAELGYRHPG
jgi:hypothetical protein